MTTPKSFKLAYLSLGFLLGVVVASVVFALFPSAGGSPTDSVTRLRIGHSLPVNHPVHAGIEYFAHRVAHLSGGRLRLDIFPNGQLGSEPQYVEQLQAATLDVAKVGGATLGSFVPVAQVFSLPYVFRDRDHFWAVLQGPVGDDLLRALSLRQGGRPTGFRGLAFYDAGSRNFYAQRPILHPDDLVGLKIRVMEDPVAIATMRAMGASPTPISWGELYTALQQGVVDGAENNAPSFVSSRHFEIAKEFSLNHHSMIPDVLIIAEATWQRLSEEERGWIIQAAEDSSVFQRQAWEAGVEEAKALMQAQGVRIHPVDVAPFIAATEPVRRRFAEGIVRDFLDRIEAVSVE
jgi:tripartite ATP-independent transporter DctP family solute receptor